MVDKNKIFQIAVNFLLISCALFCLIPILLLVVSSFTDEAALLQNGYKFWPSKFSTGPYEFLFRDSTLLIRSYGISIITTVVGTTIHLIMAMLFAYPLSRPNLPGKNAMSFYVFFTMLFNGGLVPSYLMWTQYFHVKNTLVALIVPFLMLNAFNIIMMRTYFTANIPEAVIEAARIDGAGEFYILFKIVMPMAVPIIATLTLMIGLNYWNSWTNGLYFITKDKLFSLQVLLTRMLMDMQALMSGGYAAGVTEIPGNGVKMAIAVMGAIPVLIVYPFFQKYFVKGITIGSVKG
jgi:putative aldouronate transport system permease protein